MKMINPALIILQLFFLEKVAFNLVGISQHLDKSLNFRNFGNSPINKILVITDSEVNKLYTNFIAISYCLFVKVFDKLAVDFESYTNRFIPISFLLGFYVTSMLNRWWDQFRLMGWPDPLMGSINLCFPGCSPEVIQQRRAYAKYLLLSTVLGWRLISVRVMKRFPTIDHVSEAGLMTKEEQKLIESKPREVQWTTPLFWIQRGIADAVTLGKLGAPIATSAQSTLNDYIMSFRYAKRKKIWTKVHQFSGLFLFA